MNPITNALTQGFTPQNVLQYLLRHFPHAKKQIESALAKGFTADKIIDFLQGGRKEVNKSVTEHEKTRQSDKDKQRGLEKGLLKGAAAIGGTALGAYALSRALPQASSALQGQLLPALPQGPAQIGARARPQLPAPGQAAMQPPPPQAPQGPLPYTNPSAQNRPIPKAPATPTTMEPSPTAPIAQQPIEPTAPAKAAPLPNEFHKMAKDMIDAGNDPDTIAGAFKKFYPEKVNKYEKSTGQPIAGAVQDFAKSNPIQTGKSETLAGGEKLPVESQSMVPIEEPSRTPEIRKTVVLPNGEIGEITNIRQGIATVNANGKEYRRKLDELIEEPEDAAMQALELIKSFTPEQERSAHHAASMYDEEDKKGIFLFHDGEGYVVENISPEEYQRLSAEVDAARTTGTSPLAVWATGGGSRGAAYQNIVKDLKKPYRKIKVGYNFFNEFQKRIKAASKKKKP